MRCEACGVIFESAWSEAEAVNEYQQRFPNAAASCTPVYVICDECFEKVTAKAMRELDEGYAQ